MVYCSVEACNYEISRTPKTTAALDHDWGDPVEVKPSYTSKGSITRVCKRNPDHISVEYTPMLIAAKVNGLDDEPKTGDLMIPAVLVLAVFGAGACLLTRKRAV